MLMAYWGLRRLSRGATSCYFDLYRNTIRRRGRKLLSAAPPIPAETMDPLTHCLDISKLDILSQSIWETHSAF